MELGYEDAGKAWMKLLFSSIRKAIQNFTDMSSSSAPGGS
jgi:hypothetical protein